MLFDETVGRPNAPVRVLVSMMILKEGHGWSDAALYEHCRFNLLVMRALGLLSLSDVAAASTPNNAFCVPAVERAQEVVGTVGEASMDGAYQDADNAAWAQREKKAFHYSGIQGGKGRFSYDRRGEEGWVEDARTGQWQRATAYKPGHYRIEVDGRKRYFTDQTVEAFERRRRVEDLPEAVRRRRNNVEASIFQLVIHTRNGKTRYRRHHAHQRWAWCRGLWINLMRIRHHLVQSSPVPA